jgi:glycosyltransferase involved in cell wall biosynthesis
LEKLIDEYKLHGQVLLPGRIHQEELRQLLNQTDAFVLPCVRDEESGRQDGIPVVLTEAMAMELPVVSTTISGIPELIDHERSGLLVPPNDAIALADALQKLSDDPALRQRLGKAGRKTVINEFNIHHSMERLARLFIASASSQEQEIIQQKQLRALPPEAKRSG